MYKLRPIIQTVLVSNFLLIVSLLIVSLLIASSFGNFAGISLAPSLGIPFR